MQIPVYDRVSSIRDYINHPWTVESFLFDKIRWNKICTSMDVIQDTQLAIEFFKKLRKFNAHDGGYLYIYGLLQVFFTQQDALVHLNTSIFETTLDLKKEFPGLYKIRELRNDAIGHPTSRNKDTSFHFIAQYSISKEGFKMSSYYPKKARASTTRVDLLECIQEQEQLSIKILDSVIERLDVEWQNHKKRFMSKKLTDLIPPSHSYMISKLYEGVYRDYPPTIINLKLLKEGFAKIVEGIKERYSSLKSSNIEHEIKVIDHIFMRLKEWLKSESYVGNLDAEVFISSLDHELKDLYKYIAEIDESFN